MSCPTDTQPIANVAGINRRPRGTKSPAAGMVARTTWITTSSLSRRVTNADWRESSMWDLLLAGITLLQPDAIQRPMGGFAGAVATREDLE